MCSSAVIMKWRGGTALYATKLVLFSRLYNN